MRVIRASEIGEYVFCHRAWWLHQVQGETSANTREMAEGTARHAWHGWQVSLAAGLRALAVLLLLAAVLAFVLSRLPAR
jgi:hypothetical protein